mgnify:CR=1 FL=1
MLVMLSLFLLNGCTQKESLSEPEITLHYTNVNNKQIKIKNNDVINIDDLKDSLVSFNAKWNYKIVSYLESPKLPKVELYKPYLRHYIYFEDEIIESLSYYPNADEYKEVEFKTDTGFFKTTAEISELTSQHIKLNDVEKVLSTKFTFKII